MNLSLERLSRHIINGQIEILQVSVCNLALSVAGF